MAASQGQGHLAVSAVLASGPASQQQQLAQAQKVSVQKALLLQQAQQLQAQQLVQRQQAAAAVLPVGPSGCRAVQLAAVGPHVLQAASAGRAAAPAAECPSVRGGGSDWGPGCSTIARCAPRLLPRRQLRPSWLLAAGGHLHRGHASAAPGMPRRGAALARYRENRGSGRSGATPLATSATGWAAVVGPAGQRLPPPPPAADKWTSAAAAILQFDSIVGGTLSCAVMGVQVHHLGPP